MSGLPIIEPFRIKSVEPIPINTRPTREHALKRAHYNLFALDSRDVMIDLLTDSGTGAMSTEQWAGILRGDESYAGSPSYRRFHDVVTSITGMPEVIPTHQGRAAEHILFSQLVEPGMVVPNNTHFDTTRANVEAQGGQALDLACDQAHLPGGDYPFKGNMNLQKLERFLTNTARERVPLVMVTVTNNAVGGQPVSMENIRGVRRICDAHQVPLFIDACRFAENAWFIAQREAEFSGVAPIDIARQVFALADGITMSCKKDGMANIGGFLALRDSSTAQDCRNVLIRTEGFPTYGGLAGRDLEAIAIGLLEALEPDYLRYRARSIAYLVEKLYAGGVPVVRPSGGHAVYIDARRALGHLPADHFPAQVLANEIYLAGGIRGVEVGSVMFGTRDEKGCEVPAERELVRLAFPRRTYTQSHVDYVAEIILGVVQQADKLRGLRITWQAPSLRHFTARLAPREEADTHSSVA